MARDEQPQCEADEILREYAAHSHSIDAAVSAVLPMLSTILTAVGAPEVGPIVQVALKVLESLHLFC